MPRHYKKKYQKKFKRRYKKKASTSKITRIASAVAKKVLFTKSEPQFVNVQLGIVKDDGDIQSQTTIPPGVTGGYGVEFPDVPSLEIEPDASTGLVKLDFENGHRKDDRIQITGVNLSGFFRLPQEVDSARVAIYMGTSKATINDQDFLVPDNCDNMHWRRPQAARTRKIYYTKILNLTHKTETTEGTVRYFKKYWDFKKNPIKIHYIEDNKSGLAWEGRRLYLNFRASYPQRDHSGTATDNEVQFVGNLTTYYRDL